MPCAGFLVPNTAVDYSYGSANKVAVMQSQWQKCFQCGQPYGFCTAVAGGSPYDQFAAYRNITIASSLSEFPRPDVLLCSIFRYFQRPSLPYPSTFNQLNIGTRHASPAFCLYLQRILTGLELGVTIEQTCPPLGRLLCKLCRSPQ